jgi:hypothetical protein
MGVGLSSQDVHAMESVINLRYPKDSPFLEHQDMTSDFRRLIDSSQMHYRSQRRGLPDEKCRFGSAQDISDEITIRRYNDSFVRDARETNIVGHNPLLLACAHAAHLHVTSSTFRVFVSLLRIHLERTSTEEFFSSTSLIVECRCFRSIASASLINQRAQCLKSGFHFTCRVVSLASKCNRDGWGSLTMSFPSKTNRRLHFCQ